MNIKSVLSTFLVGIIVFVANVPVYATETLSLSEQQAQHHINFIETVVDLSCVTNDITTEKKSYNIQGESAAFSIPKHGSGGILINTETTEPVTMGLPKEVTDVEGVLTAQGTIVYASEEEAVTVCVQALEEKMEGETINAIRSLVTIENNTAPSEYAFYFELPKDYRLVTVEDFVNLYVPEKEKYMYDPNDLGDLIYIIDENGTIINTIDEPWAVDANGESVETFYEIKENVLYQKVMFDENSNFPIIADPTSYPPKTKYNQGSIPRGNVDIAISCVEKLESKQNSTLSQFISMMSAIIGWLEDVSKEVNYTVGAISAVQGGVNADLDRQIAIYNKIIRVYASTNATNKKVTRAIIMYPLYGTWQGKNKGYMYRQDPEYVKFYSAAGAEITVK